MYCFRDIISTAVLHETFARAGLDKYFPANKLQLGVRDVCFSLPARSRGIMRSLLLFSIADSSHGKLPLLLATSCSDESHPPSNDDNIHCLLFLTESTMKQHSGPPSKGPVTCQYFLSDYHSRMPIFQATRLRENFCLISFANKSSKMPSMPIS